MKNLRNNLSLMIPAFLFGILGAILLSQMGDPVYEITAQATEHGIEYTIMSTAGFRSDPIFRTQRPEQAWGIWYGMSNNIKLYEESKGTPVPPSKSNGQRYDPDNPGLTQKAVPIR